MVKSKYRRKSAAHGKNKQRPVAVASTRDLAPDSADLTQTVNAQDVATISMAKPMTEAPVPPSTSPAEATSPKTTSPKTTASETASPATASPEAERLDQIRDILFGQQVQTHDRRFEALEQRLSEDYAHLRNDFLERIEALESRFMDHVDSLTERLRDAETARDRQGATLDEKIADTDKDLRAEIKHQTLTLTANLEQQIEDVLHRLEQESTVRKQVTHTERTRLSSLLGELSKQLSASPSGEDHAADNAPLADKR